MKILYHHRTTASDGSAVHIDGLITALRSLGADVILTEPRGLRTAKSGANVKSSLRRKLPPWLHELLELAYNVLSGCGCRRLLRAIVRT